jgi:hypothetical protein
MVPPGDFSTMLVPDSAMSLGASLTLVTLMTKGFAKALPFWSVARTVIGQAGVPSKFSDPATLIAPVDALIAKRPPVTSSVSE